MGQWITSKHRKFFIPERQKILKKINKDFGKFNCQTCVVAYEAAMRGIDIQVEENKWNSPIINLLAKRPEIAYQDKKTGLHPKPLDKKVNNKKEAMDFLKENIISNGRYELACKLILSDKLSHILCIEKTKDGFRMIDPQKGTMSNTQKEIEQYLNLIDFSKSLTLLRVDNMNFTPQFLDFIKSE